MGRLQQRLMVCAMASLVLIVMTAIFRAWFHVRLAVDIAGVTTIDVDLHSVSTCTPQGVCASVGMNHLKGLYPTMASGTLYTAIALAVLVAYQAATRLIGGFASQRLTKIGYMVCLAAFSNAGATAYFFGPEAASFGADAGIAVDRTWAPALMLLGVVLGGLALYFTTADELYDDRGGEYKPVTIAALPPADARQTPQPATAARAATPLPVSASSLPSTERATTPLPATPARAATPLPVSASSLPSTERATTRLPATGARRPSGAASETPRPARSPSSIPLELPGQALRGKLSYACITVELSAAGIDARHEDGGTRLVLWRDVVGVVARRLPAESPYDGTTFIDLVSDAGATLRILPWTRISGDPLDGTAPPLGGAAGRAQVPAGDGDGDERARAFVKLVSIRCPEAKLDGATHRFVGSDGNAAQLPDVATLAAHDARLA